MRLCGIFRIVLFLVLLSAEVVTGQTNTYWLKLKDKKGTTYSLSKPEAFLSQRSLNRRTRQHITLDDTDLPVSKVYLDSLKKMGLELVHSSKWLNGATVRTADTALIRKVGKLSFVLAIQLTKSATNLKSAHRKFVAEASSDDYGTAFPQLTQLNGQYLHNLGFRGKGIQIAVLDAGFWQVDKYAVFDSLRIQKRILTTRDVVNPKSDFYKEDSHGTSVLSCMGGNLSGQHIGTAPDASYDLIRTEDDATEYLTEEDNWIVGAELADSLGADVINSSLGYCTFDDSSMDHAYADLNGSKTRITQGANMAFQKGILVVASAGNEGNKLWKRIVAPADGTGVIAVGAVDRGGKLAYFSSLGPAFGGAIKPNVVAMGLLTSLASSDGTINYSSGTSFSSPVLAGLGACLMQSNPYANVKQVKLAIEQSASQYNKPDSLLGYGIPDFEKADKYLKLNSFSQSQKLISWSVFPNPFTDWIVVRGLSSEQMDPCTIRIFSIQGVCLWESTSVYSDQITLTGLDNLPSGVLILEIQCKDVDERIKVIRLRH